MHNSRSSLIHVSGFRFTSYDFRKMQRRSYSSRPVTPMTIGNDGMQEEYALKHKAGRTFDDDELTTPITPITPTSHQVNHVSEKEM